MQLMIPYPQSTIQLPWGIQTEQESTQISLPLSSLFSFSFPKGITLSELILHSLLYVINHMVLSSVSALLFHKSTFLYFQIK